MTSKVVAGTLNLIEFGREQLSFSCHISPSVGSRGTSRGWVRPF